MRSAGAVIKRTLVSFYDDQMTHHAAALTYYSLMSLFPATLLGLSLLGLLGQYPSTYNAIINYLRDVVPHSALVPLDSSLREALQHKGTAVTAFVTSVVLTLYGTTGVLEAARRALNVVFELDGGGRSFLRRKSIDIVFTFVLMGLVLASLIMLFVGGRFASDLFGFIGLGPTAASIWSVARWPGALAVTTLIFALIYYVTPDVKQRAFRWVTPGAFVGVLVWLVASVGFSAYISQVADVGALFGAFAGAIVLVGWLWLTNVALLFGAELDAEIERQKELGEGVPERRDAQPRRRGGSGVTAVVARNESGHRLDLATTHESGRTAEYRFAILSAPLDRTGGTRPAVGLPVRETIAAKQLNGVPNAHLHRVLGYPGRPHPRRGRPRVGCGGNEPDSSSLGDDPTNPDCRGGTQGRADNGLCQPRSDCLLSRGRAELVSLGRGLAFQNPPRGLGAYSSSQAGPAASTPAKAQ